MRLRAFGGSKCRRRATTRLTRQMRRRCWAKVCGNKLYGVAVVDFAPPWSLHTTGTSVGYISGVFCVGKCEKKRLVSRARQTHIAKVRAQNTVRVYWCVNYLNRPKYTHTTTNQTRKINSQQHLQRHYIYIYICMVRLLCRLHGPKGALCAIFQQLQSTIFLLVRKSVETHCGNACI